MRFVIDETSWKFNGLSQAVFLEKIETFLDLIDSQIEKGNIVCYSEDLFHSQVFGDLCFYDLYNPVAPISIPWYIRERISITFAHLQKWEDFDSWPTSFDIKILPHGILEPAPSIAWAHHRNNSNVIDTIASLVFPGGRVTGFFDVEVANVTRPAWFISSEIDCVKFFRWIILNGTTSPAQLERFANAAFPQLDFVPNVFNGIKTMSKPYILLLPNIVHHLSIFSDEGKKIFSGPHIDVPAKFGSLGLNVSDENGNTKSNSEAKKDHTRTFNGKETQFWWHSKLELDRDRIHLDPTPLNSRQKIVIGIFCRHLTT